MSSISQIEPAVTETFELEHQIFVLDAGLRNRLDFRRHREITRCFVDDLLGVLGMEPLGELGIYPAADQRAPGWSFIQPITTSHVSAHYFEKPGPAPHIRLDAYSCESVNWRRLIEVCDRHFELSAWRATFIDRQIEWENERAVVEVAGTGTEVTAECSLTAAAVTSEGGPTCIRPAR